jgi:beta-glucanase (GH16 family)
LAGFRCFMLNAQTPSSDPHWELIHDYDFDSIDTTEWHVFDNYDHSAHIQVPESPLRDLIFLSKSSNVRTEESELVIELIKEKFSCPKSARHEHGCSAQAETGDRYHYTSGYVQSIQDYLYGYIEARIKCPNDIGLNTAFWTFVNNGQPYSEIDIFELLPGAFINGSYHDENVMSSNIHWLDSAGIVRTDFRTYGIDDYTDYHTYAVEWTPDKIILYVDGKVVRNSINQGIVYSSHLIFDVGFSGWKDPIITSSHVKMLVDWVRIYALRDDCEKSIDTCSYDFSSHDNRVKKDIIIGGGGCENRISPWQRVVLRATDGIEIKGDFTVPLGAEFYADVNQCIE